MAAGLERKAVKKGQGGTRPLLVNAERCCELAGLFITSPGLGYRAEVGDILGREDGVGFTPAASSFLGEVFLPLLVLLESCHGTVNRGKERLALQTGGSGMSRNVGVFFHACCPGRTGRADSWEFKVAPRS